METIYNPQIQKDELICPITLEVFRDPVIAKDGHAYEREAITHWIIENGTSPLTREPLTIEDLVPAVHLKHLAERRRSSTVSRSIYNGIGATLPSDEQSNENNRIKSPKIRKYCFSNWKILIIVCLFITGTIVGPVMAILFNRSKGFGIKSRYSSILTENSPLFNPYSNGYSSNLYSTLDVDYYYESIPLTVLRSGKYKLTGQGYFSIHAYLYQIYFNSTYPKNNRLAQNSGYGISSEFKLMVNLQSDTQYYLVISSYIRRTVGSFSITVYGPSTVYFGSITDITSSTSTELTITTMCSASIYSTYSSSWTNNNPIFSRPFGIYTNYHYCVIQLYFTINGYYTITSRSSINTYGYIYSDEFNSPTPYDHLYVSSTNDAINGQFRLRIYLVGGDIYFLVVTTLNPGDIGSFSIDVCGPGELNFIDTTTSFTNQITTPIQPSIINSFPYSSVWNVNSLMFNRLNNTNSKFYYEVLQLSISSTNIYDIYGSSNIGIRIQFYQNYFDPLNPYKHLIFMPNSNFSSNYFRQYIYLESDVKYYMVITTFLPNMIGTFTIYTVYPSGITFTHVTNVSAISSSEITNPCGNFEIHVIGVYQSRNSNQFQFHSMSNATVRIERPGEQILVLSSYQSTQWHIYVASNTILKAIHLIGYSKQNVVAPYDIIVITNLTYSDGECGYSWPYNGGGCYTNHLLSLARQYAGGEITSFHGCYDASNWTIGTSFPATSNCNTASGYQQYSYYPTCMSI